MELRSYLQILRRRWISAVAVLLSALAVAVLYSLVATPQYTVTTRLFFSVEGSGTVTDLAQGSSFAERQMTSYALVARSPLVLDRVIQRLALEVSADDLAESIEAVVPADTVVLEISGTDTDPEQAVSITNAIGNEVINTVARLSPKRVDGSTSVVATVLSRAQLPPGPTSPNLLRNLAVALAAGVVGGIGVALLRNVLDTKVRSEQDVHTVTDHPILGVIAFDAEVPSHPAILRDDPRSPAAEAIRRLRTNLQFVEVDDHPNSIVITSSVPGEGKTTTSINLAVALSDAGTRVLLIDADLRRPSIAGYLGLEGAAGLTTALIGRATLGEVVQPWGSSTLDVLPSGQVPPNPSELLGSKAMRTLLGEATAAYDVVLIDSPPVLPVTDAAVLGRMAGGLLIIAGVDRIHRRQIKETLDSLAMARCHVLGLVINKIARREVAGYAYEGGYYGTPATIWGEAAPAEPEVPATDAARTAETPASSDAEPAPTAAEAVVAEPIVAEPVVVKPTTEERPAEVEPPSAAAAGADPVAAPTTTPPPATADGVTPTGAGPAGRPGRRRRVRRRRPTTAVEVATDGADPR